ncbi:MAG: fluoride efflux transporter CrcB [Flammeovirgaceae bacterium]|nr:fluoride efflux transporter CrcB [Flammeovirgaceae bacterium]MBE61074.1 fluoride efflux transporter CrcB [Flammeovirgaceae bacterium]MBR10775.1 fluoride efflux transporter CrcB [Rickettsiales bacterium]HCX23035.1 fluoride efflux transporter CrcB [Cytophagales bacterium]|tara:strand:+ start:163 stop:534 length:372 start_codon:yes stop_codon:yes gene_type:complete
MKEVIYVAIGGALGSVSRYLMGILMTSQLASPYPYATLSVNLAGSLLIGILSGIFIKSGSPITQFMLITGFCGGFTTFSTFSLDGLKLLESGEFTPFILYVSISIVGGLLLCFGGFWLSNKLM